MEWVKDGTGGVKQRNMNEGTVGTGLGESPVEQVALVLLV